MKTVFLVLLDAVEDAAHVASFAARLAQPAGAELVLVHVEALPVVEPNYGLVLGAPEYLPPLPDLSEPLTALARQLPVPVTLESSQGTLAGAVQQAILRYQPQLLVLGLQEEHAWLDRLLLNQAVPVLRDTRLPLLLVPPKAAQVLNSPLKVLLAVDCEPIHLTQAAAAFNQVLHRWQPAVTVAHVSEPEAATESNMHLALKSVRTSGLLAQDAGHGYHMQDPSCAAGILRAATATQADLLMLIARPRSFLNALFHHSITADVMRRSTIPLLLLPVEEESGTPAPSAASKVQHQR